MLFLLAAVSLPSLACDCTAVFTAVSCRPLAWRSRASLGTSVTCSYMLRALSCLVSALVRAAVLHRRTLARCRLRFLLRFHAARSHAALPLLAAYCAARGVICGYSPLARCFSRVFVSLTPLLARAVALTLLLARATKNFFSRGALTAPR